MKRLLIARTCNALLALTLMGILLAAYYQQYFKHETPCPLCILQRLGMIGVAIGALLNLRFGIQMKHYGLSLCSIIFGSSVALRQICLHICPGFPIYGIPVYSLNLYTWSFISFACSTFVITLLLFLYSPKDPLTVRLNWFEKLAFIAVFALALLNLITTWMECGFGPCPDVPWPQA